MPVTIRNPSVLPDLSRYKGEANDLTAKQALSYVWNDKTVRVKGRQTSSAPIGIAVGSAETEHPLRNAAIIIHSRKGPSTEPYGFVRAVVFAYNNHQSLIIRPDDVWIAILSQLNLYVNAHAEELRSFVQHEGQRELEVEAIGDRHTVDFGAMVQSMGQQLKENINDPLLYDFIMPNFSTTTANDKIICSVMMMSALKSFFRYIMRTRCGIPSITLLGEKSDYESLMARLEKLAPLGREPHIVARLLRPILTQFVNVFDEPPVMDFWTKICHYNGGSGSTFIGGWITAFCTWGAEGKCMGCDIERIDAPLSNEEKEYIARYEAMGSDRVYEQVPVLALDGVRYPAIDMADIPNGISQVDIKLDDNGQELK